MELARRWGLLVCLSLGLWLMMYVPLRPFLTLEPADVAQDQKRATRLTERGRELALLPPSDDAAEATKAPAIPVQGAEWQALFDDVTRTSRGEPPSKAWWRRVSSDEKKSWSSSRQVFFRPAEPLFRSLAGRFEKPHQKQVLVLAGPEGTRYLDLEYHVMSNDDFNFGSGYSHYPKVPRIFFHPFWTVGLWLILAGAAAYLVFPWAKKRPGAIYYPAWRVRLGDFASLLLFVPFFWLPLLIIGGSVQAFLIGWILILIMWPLAFVGAWLLWQMAWYAGYQVVVEPEGIRQMSMRGETFFPFAKMSHYQPLVLKPPRWLIIAGWLAALSGKGAGRFGAAGRALMLEGTAYQGLGVGLRDGSAAFFWLTDQMGSQALKNSGKMLKALEAAGVAKKPETRVITAITMPTEEGPTKKLKGSSLILGVLLAMPIVVLIVVSLALFFSKL